MQITKLYRIKYEKNNRFSYINATVEEKEVIEETSRSYVIRACSENKINKKTLLSSPDFGGIRTQYFLTPKDAEDYIWYQQNRHRILDKVDRSGNIELFKELDRRL